jgi:hypothetical protein
MRDLQTIKKINMRVIFSLLAVTGLLVGFSSCYNDKEELLYGSTMSCDTASAISYTQKIVPLFQNACYSCHSGPSPSGAIAMGTYATDKAVAASGRLVGSLEHASGYSAMPQGAAKFSACSISQVKKWISSGTPNN